MDDEKSQTHSTHLVSSKMFKTGNIDIKTRSISLSSKKEIEKAKIQRVKPEICTFLKMEILT